MGVGSGGRWRSVAEVDGGWYRRSAEVSSGGRWSSVAEVGGGR